jgi:hypothetical protein
VRIFIHPASNDDLFYWNIRANVGLNSPNNPEDVQLVQFGYLAKSLMPDTTPAEKPIYAAVTPGAVYTGSQNDPLTLAILTHQKIRGGTQDGHVSVIRGERSYIGADGPHTFMLIALVNCMRDLMPDAFPRLDKHPKCPDLLKKAVLRSLTGRP